MNGAYLGEGGAASDARIGLEAPIDLPRHAAHCPMAPRPRVPASAVATRGRPRMLSALLELAQGAGGARGCRAGLLVVVENGEAFTLEAQQAGDARLGARRSLRSSLRSAFRTPATPCSEISLRAGVPITPRSSTMTRLPTPTGSPPCWKRRGAATWTSWGGPVALLPVDAGTTKPGRTDRAAWHRGHDWRATGRGRASSARPGGRERSPW